MSDNSELIKELRLFHHYEAAEALEAVEPMEGWERVVAERIEAERDALTVQLAAAQAVIAEAQAWGENVLGMDDALVLRDIFAQSPTDALEAVKHDAWAEGVEAQSWNEGVPTPQWIQNPYRTASIASEPEANNA